MLVRTLSSTSRGWPELLQTFLTEGKITTPRGLETREITVAMLESLNPRERLINPSKRNFNLPAVMAETLDFLFNPNPGTAPFYNSVLKNFMDENGKIIGYYGDRLSLTQYKYHQFKRIYQLLKRDPASRQAVVIIHNPLIEKYESKDVSCTLGLQFLLRDGKLDVITNMRSEDLFLGFCYDTFTFTFYQELLAADLEVEVGRYHHLVGSMHLYATNYDNAREIIEASAREPNLYDRYPIIPIDKRPFEILKNQLSMVNQVNRATVEGDISLARKIHEMISIPAFREWSKTFLAEYHRRRKEYDRSDEIADTIQNEFKQFFDKKRELRAVDQVANR